MVPFSRSKRKCRLLSACRFGRKIAQRPPNFVPLLETTQGSRHICHAVQVLERGFLYDKGSVERHSSISFPRSVHGSRVGNGGRRAAGHRAIDGHGKGCDGRGGAGSEGLKNANTNVSRTTTSNRDGDYLFTLVSIGSYELTAEHTGFSKSCR